MDVEVVGMGVEMEVEVEVEVEMEVERDDVIWIESGKVVRLWEE